VKKVAENKNIWRSKKKVSNPPNKMWLLKSNGINAERTWKNLKICIGQSKNKRNLSKLSSTKRNNLFQDSKKILKEKMKSTSISSNVIKKTSTELLILCIPNITT
jgi:hypothetical protein